MKKILFVLSWLVLGSLTLGAEAGWELLGKKSVMFKADRDDVLVGSKDGKFSKLMIKVDDNDIEIEKMIVTYGVGKDEIPVRHVFKEGSRSRIIDLKGGDRVIRKITFFYKTVGKLREGRAEIQVFGRN